MTPVSSAVPEPGTREDITTALATVLAAHPGVSICTDARPAYGSTLTTWRTVCGCGWGRGEDVTGDHAAHIAAALAPVVASMLDDARTAERERVAAAIERLLAAVGTPAEVEADVSSSYPLLRLTGRLRGVRAALAEAAARIAREGS